MNVILQEELHNKGGEGDVIDVARGFANYLMIQGIAIEATKGNLKQLEQRRKNIAKREEVRVANAEKLKAALEAAPVVVKARVGEEGQLFGSVTAQMIVDAVKAQMDLEIDRRRVDDRQTIKTVGEHEVTVAIYREIKAAVKLNVVDETTPEPEPEPEVEPEAESEVEAVEEAVEAAPEAADSEETEEAAE